MYIYTRSLDLRNFKGSLEKDVTYINHNRLIYCDGSFYVNETDQLSHEYYHLEATKSIDFHGLSTRHFSKYEGFVNDEDIWSSEKVDETLCIILQKLRELWNIPPFITIKPKSTISLMQLNDDITKCYIHLEGMMDPSKSFSDFQLFSMFLLTTDGLMHCPNCGWLYDGCAQCDCSWRYDDYASEGEMST